MVHTIGQVNPPAASSEEIIITDNGIPSLNSQAYALVIVVSLCFIEASDYIVLVTYHTAQYPE